MKTRAVSVSDLDLRESKRVASSVHGDRRDNAVKPIPHFSSNSFS
jgi:hypothetical protein